jgi:hypothetical protein
MRGTDVHANTIHGDDPLVDIAAQDGHRNALAALFSCAADPLAMDVQRDDSSRLCICQWPRRNLLHLLA